MHKALRHPTGDSGGVRRWQEALNTGRAAFLSALTPASVVASVVAIAAPGVTLYRQCRSMATSIADFDGCQASGTFAQRHSIDAMVAAAYLGIFAGGYYLLGIMARY